MSNATMKFVFIACFVSLLLPAESHRQSTFFATYKCIGGRCQRANRPVGNVTEVNTDEYTTLSSCRLICNERAGLWPEPTGSCITGNSYTNVHPENFFLHFSNEKSSQASLFLSEAFQHFQDSLRSTCAKSCAKISTRMVTVKVSIESESLELDWNTDETYRLDIQTEGEGVIVRINGITVFGARHALETLSQLTALVRTVEGEYGLVILENASISDGPLFPHRGLLIDTARNFLSVEDILRTIDGLSYSKMNVLHWHATDSQSFPLEIARRPMMAKFGAYGEQKIYSAKDMTHIVSYAKARGVRVILELDTPSHAGAGWEWGKTYGLGDLAVCVNRQPWRDYCVQPPCGQLNPVNPNTYTVLGDIYKDILQIWQPNAVLHLGGDEVFLPCWNATAEITTAMTNKGMDPRRVEDFLKLWGDFHVEQLQVLDTVRSETQRNAILWSSQLTLPDHVEKYLDKSRFIIQTWVEAESDIPQRLLALGYRLIISTKNTWYLDHGFWGITKYHTWRDAYNNRIPRNNGVLGGEACMWGEYVNGGSLDTRIWPRTAAVAERLWTDPSRMTTVGVETRLQAHRERFQTRGIETDALAPEWCAQHEGQCS